MRSEIRSVSASLLLGAAALLAAGCQSARVERPVTAEFGGADPDAQLNFWHTLAEQPVTSNDDAFHGLLLYLDGEDPSPDYASRVEAMKSRGLLPRGFDAPAEQAVDRGTLAVAIARALDIRGGLVMQLTGGGNPRYAVRELQFMGLYPPSTPNQTFSGTEFLGIMGKVEDYQRGRETPETEVAAADEAADDNEEVAPEDVVEDDEFVQPMPAPVDRPAPVPAPDDAELNK